MNFSNYCNRKQWHEDKGSVETAITFAVSQLEEKWGVDQSCQIIIIINGMSLNENANFCNTLSIPSHIKVHIICNEERKEVKYKGYHSLCKRSGGSYQFIELPKNAHLVKPSLYNILDRYCTIFFKIVNIKKSRYEI